MEGVDGSVWIYLVCFLSLGNSGALKVSVTDVNGTQSAGDVEGGKTPVMLTIPSQIIAREGNCVLIDCNITGEPFPKVQWFNSHGHPLDTEENGRLMFRTIVHCVKQSELTANTNK